MPELRLFPEPSLTSSSSLLAGLPAPRPGSLFRPGLASDRHVD